MFENTPCFGDATDARLETPDSPTEESPCPSMISSEEFKKMRVSDSDDVLELLGCVGCGDSFHSTSELEIHQDTCPGLISGNECEPSRNSNCFLACARCPEMSFVNRCELILHLKLHRNQRRRRCICRRRPCRCLKRCSSRRSTSLSGAATRIDRDPSSTAQVSLCHECFERSLQFENDAPKCEKCCQESPVNPLQ